MVCNGQMKSSRNVFTRECKHECVMLVLEQNYTVAQTASLLLDDILTQRCLINKKLPKELLIDYLRK